MGTEDIGGLESASLLGTEHALYHKAAFETENFARVAEPIALRQLFNPVATLVHRDIAVSTKHYQVFVLIIPTVANRTLSIFLCDQCSFVGTHVLIPNVIQEIRVASLLTLFKLF